LTEEDDAGASFLFGGEKAIAVGIEKTEDGLVGTLPAPVFEDFHIRVFGKLWANFLRQPNRAVVLIVMTDEATHETNHNIGRKGGLFGGKRGGIDSAREVGRDCTENRECHGQNTNWSHPAHAES